MSLKQAANAAFMPLFSIEVLHRYLNEGAYAAFTITPLGTTQEVLQRSGWSVAQVENKFTLYADRARAAAVLKQGVTAALNLPDLCYALQFRDPDFAKYTDLPMRTGHVLSFAGTAMPDHVSANDLVMVQAGSFECSVAKEEEREEFWLENVSGGKVMTLPPSERGHVRADTAALPMGLYHVIQAGRRLESFVKLDSAFHFQPAAVLCLSVQQLRNVLKSEGEALHVRLVFAARRTVWRYDFFNHGVAAAQDYAVVPAAQGGGQVEFQQVAGMTGPGGEVSLAFESRSAIPLTAQPRERFMLLRHGQTLVAELPTPGMDLSRGGEGALCSRQFVYL